MHQPGTFFDVETGAEAQFHLDMVNDKNFKLLQRFGYIELESPHREFQVPRDLDAFCTDLTSTPAYFTWLVPSTGAHLPAALLHDGMVYNKEKEGATYIGPAVSRLEADVIFRDAMKALGTGPIRRWIVWSAVTLVTSWVDLPPRLLWRSLGVLTAVVMLILGTLATADLFDWISFYPWMGERSFVTELIAGGIGAILLPAIICIPWRRLYPAALIATILFAFLIHVTIVIAVLLGSYHLIEWFAKKIEHVVAGFQDSPAPQEQPQT